LHEKVLIVEDNALIALSLREVLSELGFQVVGTAATMSEALRMAEDTKPDIAVSDIRLAGQHDGTEAAIRMRQRSGLPVLFLTAATDLATRTKAAAAEPAGYLVKPVNANQLGRAVELALRAISDDTHSAKQGDGGHN